MNSANYHIDVLCLYLIFNAVFKSVESRTVVPHQRLRLFDTGGGMSMGLFMGWSKSDVVPILYTTLTTIPYVDNTYCNPDYV